METEKKIKLILIDPDGNNIGAVSGKLCRVRFEDGEEVTFLTDAEIIE